jgi:hypothetical protein
MGVIRHAPDEVWVAGDEHGPLGVKPKPYPGGPRVFGTWETMYVRADLHRGAVEGGKQLDGVIRRLVDENEQLRAELDAHNPRAARGDDLA